MRMLITEGIHLANVHAPDAAGLESWEAWVCMRGRHVGGGSRGGGLLGVDGRLSRSSGGGGGGDTVVVLLKLLTVRNFVSGCEL